MFYTASVDGKVIDPRLIPTEDMKVGEIGRYAPDGINEGHALVLKTYAYWVNLSNPGCDWGMPPNGRVRLLDEGETVILRDSSHG